MKEEGLKKYIVHLVLDEMKSTEEIMTKMGLSWTDKYRTSHCLPIYYGASESEIKALEEKYDNRYSLVNAFYNDDSIGVPLETVTLEEDDNGYKTGPKTYEVGFGRIDWILPETHGITREFTFHNDGNISFTKKSKNNKVVYTYNTSFNVLTNDFDIDLHHHSNDSESEIIFQIKDNQLAICFNGEGKSIDLESGEETDITKSYLSYNRKNIEDAIEQAIWEIKTVKGEFLLPGLREKVDNGLQIISSHKYNRRR